MISCAIETVLVSTIGTALIYLVWELVTDRNLVGTNIHVGVTPFVEASYVLALALHHHAYILPGCRSLGEKSRTIQSVHDKFGCHLIFSLEVILEEAIVPRRVFSQCTVILSISDCWSSATT
jgi:hypothetical protein